ncbi:MAG: putative toxin-antitoxin system toxin component, PIN family [Candidatus Altiarchaeales archaeon]|nr:putative toxin-antitoxin system toxin component, PIN family [Candidatus Altiarchaeales archaeon]
MHEREIRIVLDTNTLISSLIGRDGNPAKVVEKLAAGDIVNYTSKPILEEVEDVIKNPLQRWEDLVGIHLYSSIILLNSAIFLKGMPFSFSIIFSFLVYSGLNSGSRALCSYSLTTKFIA